MINSLIGKKIEQTQKFLENGKRIPVTQINVADNSVLQVKTVEKERYAALQLGFGVKKRANKALTGHSKKAGFDITAEVIREVTITDTEAEDLPKVGELVTASSVFKPGDIITVTGTSKGKGFAGVVKRYNFRGGPKTHGQSDRHRAPGSIGQGTTPGRVYKGKRMAGRMGSDTVTIANLVVVAVDETNKILSVSGLVPGHRETVLYITKTGEQKTFVPLLEEAEKAKALEAAAAEQAAKEAEAAKIAEEKAAAENKTEEAEQPETTEETEVKTEEPKVEEKKEEAK
jgi:large subunit ribosomal protein L3